MNALSGERAGRPTGITSDRACVRGRARRLALRLAFVGSAACGVVLWAGAAAHADTLGTDAVSATVDATAPVTDAVASTADATSPAVDPIDPSGTSQTIDAATDAATSVARQTQAAVDDTVRTVSDAVGDTVGTVSDAVGDATSTATATVDTLSTKPLDVVDDAPTGVGPRPLAVGSILVRTVSVRIRLLREDVAVRSAASWASDSIASALEVDRRAGSGRVATDAPPAGASPVPAPAWPPGAAPTGIVLSLVGAIIVRMASGPPRGWKRIASPTTPFFGAAIALAVERPG